MTAVSLGLGLLIRGFMGPEDAGRGMELMMRARSSAIPRADDAGFRSVVDVFRAPPLPSIDPPAAPAMSFDGRPLRKAREMSMLVTAYSPDERSCGKWADGQTASGYSVWTNGMKLVAADTKLLPFGTIVTVPGYNDDQPVQVLDRGGKIKGHRLDVLYPTHEIARNWGAQRLTIAVWEYAD